MHYPTALAFLSALIPALAAPAPQAAPSSQWTLTSFTRTCNPENTSCNYAFGIDTHAGAPTACAYTVTGSPAANTAYNGQVCGAFTISSGWSGQFGTNAAFSTLAVTDQANIVYPSYTDAQLVSGVAVTPDQSYSVQGL